MNEKSTAFGIILAEGILILTVILSLTVIKYFLPDLFGQIKSFYNSNITAETDINDVIDTSGGDVVEV